ncbi:hypothetical protein GWI33_016602 [Rhynchophorus ferrugineus]|uniref:Uncharacterized protein n=1 Tax=Rhynchophorus ferrugineus TaxID=354439 RepID=A0A834I0N8_RHYFE|nr:hypothetical protein GWI33_016602 [Rhynchophorus ferrugineus]
MPYLLAPQMHPLALRLAANAEMGGEQAVENGVSPEDVPQALFTRSGRPIAVRLPLFSDVPQQYETPRAIRLAAPVELDPRLPTRVAVVLVTDYAAGLGGAQLGDCNIFAETKHISKKKLSHQLKKKEKQNSVYKLDYGGGARALPPIQKKLISKVYKITKGKRRKKTNKDLPE